MFIVTKSISERHESRKLIVSATMKENEYKCNFQVVCHDTKSTSGESEEEYIRRRKQQRTVQFVSIQSLFFQKRFIYYFTLFGFKGLIALSGRHHVYLELYSTFLDSA